MKRYLTILAATLALSGCGGPDEADADFDDYDDPDASEWGDEDPDDDSAELGRVDVSLGATATQWPGYCGIIVFESEDATSVTAMVNLSFGPPEVVAGESGESGRIDATAVREGDTPWRISSLLYEAPVVRDGGDPPPAWIADATMPDTAFEMRIDDAPWQAGDFEKNTGSAIREPYDAAADIGIEGNMIDPTPDNVRRARGEFRYEGSCEITAQRVAAPPD